MADTNTSPTLTLKIRSPDALANLQALRAGVDALKASLAGLSSSGSSAGVARLEAEVRELRAALQATRMEVEALSKVNEAKTAAAIAGTQREVAAVKQRTAAVKSAAEEEKAQAEANAAYLLKVQLRSAEMTGALAIKANAAVEASLGQHLARQEAQRERSAVRQAALLERQVVSQVEAQAAATAAVEASLAKQIVAQERAVAVAIAAQQRAAAAAARRAEIEAAAASAGTNRSALRGLAAAGGSTFLTYGSNIPAVVGGFAAGATLYSSVKDGSEFNYQTQFAGALNNMDPQAIAAMREELRKLGTDGIYGPIELAKGMRILQQAGIAAGEALAILPTSMKVALQGETDLTKASETLVGVMNQFGLTIKDVPRIGDVMSKTASVTQANMGSLMESMKTFIGISQKYNISLEQSLALMGLLAKQGITGQSAGTFTRRFFEELYTPRSTDARRAYRELGYTSGGPGYDAKGNQRSADEVVNDFTQRVRGFDVESRNKLLSAIFDQRSIKEASILVNDLGNEYEKLRKKIDDSGGALSEFQKNVEPTTKLLWKEVKSNFEGAMIDMFKSIEGPLQALLEAMKNFFKDEATISFLKLIAMVPAGYMNAMGLVSAAAYKPGRDGALNPYIGSDVELLERAKKDIAGLRARGVVEGAGLRGGTLTQQLDLEARLRANMSANQYAPTMAAENARLLNRAVIFNRAPGEDTPEGAAGGAPGLKRASMRVIDPLEAQEQHQLSLQKEAEAIAQAKRENQKTEQTANDQSRILDLQHKHNLISEQDYTRSIDAVNEQRRQSAIRTATEEIAALAELEKGKWTPAEKARNEERQREIVAARDKIVRESQFQTEIRGVRDMGLVADMDRETKATLAKHAATEAQRLEQLKLISDARLMPEEVAAQYLARFDARKSFEPELIAADKEIAKFKGPGPQRDKADERKRLILEARDAYEALRGSEARERTERERSFTYGQQDIFKQYVTAATNAAQNARDVWSTAFKSIEDGLFKLVKTGKGQWKDYAGAIGDEIIRQQIRRGIAAATPGFSSLGGSIMSLFSTPTAHTGGILGVDSLSMRSVSPSVFAGAPRFHGGGIVGGSELPIIAKYGEGVFTPAQMQALGGGMGGGPTFFIDATGADAAGMARLEARINAIHGSIEHRSVAAVRKAYARVGVRAPG